MSARAPGLAIPVRKTRLDLIGPSIKIKGLDLRVVTSTRCSGALTSSLPKSLEQPEQADSNCDSAKAHVSVPEMAGLAIAISCIPHRNVEKCGERLRVFANTVQVSMIDDINTAGIFENDVNLVTVITAWVLIAFTSTHFRNQLNSVDVMQAHETFRCLTHEVQARTPTTFPETACVLVEHDGSVYHIERATTSNNKDRP